MADGSVVAICRADDGGLNQTPANDGWTAATSRASSKIPSMLGEVNQGAVGVAVGLIAGADGVSAAAGVAARWLDSHARNGLTMEARSTSAIVRRCMAPV
jgi:hypothetical protein